MEMTQLQSDQTAAYWARRFPRSAANFKAPPVQKSVVVEIVEFKPPVELHRIRLMARHHRTKMVPKRISSLHCSWKQILNACCEATLVPVERVKSPCRKGDTVITRHVAAYLMRKYTALSFPAIGEKLMRDHSSIHHGWEKVSKNMVNYIHIIQPVERILFRECR